jgi:N6-adenosine-specific RNA methylase IME4
MRYVAILMDPPWNETGGGSKGANAHYGLIKKKEQIRDVILGDEKWQPAEDAHLYMWVTNTFLAEGLWLMEALGFEYKTNFPWVKASRTPTKMPDNSDAFILKPERMGIGQYGRGCHELLLFGVRGKGYNACAVNPDGQKTTVRTDFLCGEPRERDENGKVIHSRKPRRQYDLINARTKPGPRLEMFARTRFSPEWDVSGNQAPDAP